MKLHLLVDSLGFPIKVLTTSSNVHDVHGARTMATFVPRFVKKVLGDKGYRGANVKNKMKKISIEKEGRWVVERTFAWINRFRRLFGFYERTYPAAENYLYLSLSFLMLNRF